MVTSNRGSDEEVSEGRRAGDGDRGGRIHVGGVEAEQCEAGDWRDKKLRGVLLDLRWTLKRMDGQCQTQRRTGTLKLYRYGIFWMHSW